MADSGKSCGEASASPPPRFPETVGYALIGLAAIVMMSLACTGRGVVHEEATLRLPFYLTPHVKAVAKIFDPAYTEYFPGYRGGAYQARELSYACDLVDSYLISACFNRGFPHMLSGSFMALVAILIGVHHWLCRHILRLDILTTAALGSLLLSTYCMSHGGQYFRSAKIGAAAGGFCLAAICIAQVQRTFAKPGWSALAAGVLALATCLFDRQGAVLVLLVMMGVGQTAAASGRRELLATLVVPMGVGLAAHALWNAVVSRAITAALHGYWPSLEFQSLEACRPLDAAAVATAVSLLLDSVRFLLANVPQSLAALVLAGLAGTACRTAVLDSGGTRRAALAYGCGLGGMLGMVLVMLTLMYLRHPEIALPDIRPTYYCLPLMVMLWAGLTLVVARGLQAASQRRLLVLGLVAAAAVGNVWAWPAHAAALREGHLGPRCAEAERIWRVLTTRWDRKSQRYSLPDEEMPIVWYNMGVRGLILRKWMVDGDVPWPPRPGLGRGHLPKVVHPGDTVE